MTNTQQKIIDEINAQLIYGDKKKIAKKAGCTPGHVGHCLNTENDAYSQKIVDASLKVIQERKNKFDNTLETLKSITDGQPAADEQPAIN
jgi:hypothetical protein